MYFSDEIKLRAITASKDADGYITQTVAETAAFANIKSATRAEFYSANANDIDITIVFEVHVEDYSSQKEVEYNSKIYEVVRTYQKGLGIIELNCSDKAV